MAKKKKEKVDGLSPDDVKKIRAAVRQVWSWSTPKRLCIARASGHPDGFPRCERCGMKCPKVYADHITAVGVLDAGFISRMFCPSNRLQALCKECHAEKTREERRVKTPRKKK